MEPETGLALIPHFAPAVVVVLTEAARRLGISRVGLVKKLNRLGLRG